MKIGMAKNVADKLSDLVEAVRKLPDEAEEALIEEFAERLSDLSGGGLTGEQRDEVGRPLMAVAPVP